MPAHQTIGILTFRRVLKEKLCERIDKFSEAMADEIVSNDEFAESRTKRQWMEKYREWSEKNNKDKSLNELIKEYLSGQ